jgi:hypothetical protein
LQQRPSCSFAVNERCRTLRIHFSARRHPSDGKSRFETTGPKT